MHASHDLPAFVIGDDDPKLSTSVSCGDDLRGQLMPSTSRQHYFQLRVRSKQQDDVRLLLT